MGFRSAFFLCLVPAALSSPRRANGMLYLACLASALSLMIVVLPLGLPAQVVSMLGLLFLRGTCTECVRAGSGLEVYGRFAKDFDFELFRAAVGSDVPSRGEAHESFQQRPHCDAGASGRVVDVVAGKRHAMFPGGITQRAAPGFASTMSRLAASARSPPRRFRLSALAH